jgi:hypothetical protein
MRAFILAGIFGIAALAFAGAGTAQAHEPRAYGGYGNGVHDYAPHWHRTDTPYGSVYWYGNGPHDYLPHHHSVSPWGGVRSYGLTPFGPTTSYNGSPYYGGGYYGGYAPYPGGYYGGGYYRSYAPDYGGYYGGRGW